MLTRLFAYGALLATYGLAAAAGADPAKPSAADLVRKVRQDEAWINQAKSFRVVMQYRWTKPPDAIERRRAELQAQFPKMEITPEKFRELRPDRTGTFQIAFDDRRLHAWDRDDAREEMYFWDGRAYSSMTADLVTGRINYGYTGEPRGESLLLSMTWPRADYHPFWFTKNEQFASSRFATSYGDPEQWVLTGRQDFHGADCHVLVRRHINSGRMYVGVADGMLHGQSNGLVIAPSKANAIAAEVAKQYGGEATDTKTLYAWANQQPDKAKRDEVLAEYSFRRFAVGFGFLENWQADYKAVAPGHWFPMTQGYFIYHTARPNAKGAPDAYDPESGKPPPVDTRRDLKAVLVEVDKPLPESMFTLGDLKDGADVVDRTKQPFLTYKVKKDMSPDEWQKVLDQATQRDTMFGQMKRAQDAALNKPAPPFAAPGKWLNTDGPRTWDSFKGKVVVVDFFGHWCGPCRNDYPTLVEVAGRKDPNLVVLGIHVASGADDAKAIAQLFKDFKITYPVYVDQDAGPGEMGQLSKAFGVRGIPHTFVIGPDGKVAAHGSLGESLDAAYKLARAILKAEKPAKSE